MTGVQTCALPILSQHLTNATLNELFAAAWDGHVDSDIVSTLDNCALWVCANDGERLVGFVKVVWDGGKHGFVLDTTTHADYQRRGVGKRLLEHAIDASRIRGIRWLHVDFGLRLTKFYRDAGFRPTSAGLLDLSQSEIGDGRANKTAAVNSDEQARRRGD